MELELVERGSDSLLIRIVGEDHTFCNLLREELLMDENVVSASYTVEHPLNEHPKFYVKVKKGKSPERALIDAAARVSEKMDELREQLQKALNNQQ